MPIRERKSTVVQDDKHRNFATAMCDYLCECRNGANRKIFTTATTPEEVIMMLEEFLSTLEDIPISYTRNSYIQDLILLLKNGNAGVAKTLGDTLGFQAASNDLVINTIDFSSVDLKESSEPDPLG